MSSQGEPRVRCCHSLPASRQYGVILPARDYALCLAHLCTVFIIPFIKSFIYRGSKIAGYHPCFFFYYYLLACGAFVITSAKG